MVFADMEKRPGWTVCTSDSAGDEGLATGNFMDVAPDVNPENYPQKAVPRNEDVGGMVVIALHLAERVGGNAPALPWDIPEAS